MERKERRGKEKQNEKEISERDEEKKGVGAEGVGEEKGVEEVDIEIQGSHGKITVKSRITSKDSDQRWLCTALHPLCAILKCPYVPHLQDRIAYQVMSLHIIQ